MIDDIEAQIDWSNPDWQKIARDMIAELDKGDINQKAIQAQHSKKGFIMQLVRARHEKKLTQVQLAERLGVSQARIAELESGKSNPTYQTLAAVAEALDYRLMLVRR